MDRLRTETDVTIHWRSYELRPAGSPPMPPEFRQRIEAARPRLYAMARDQYGLELNSGPLGIDSRPALVGAKYAQAHGLADAYSAAVFRAYWQQAQDIGDRAVLAALALAVGLDRAGFLAALDAPDLNAAVDADVAQAQAYGLTGVPATVIDSRYLVMGAQPYAVLRQAVEEAAGA